MAWGKIGISDWLFDRTELDPVPNPIPHVLADLIVEAVDDMPEPYRQLIEMRYWERLTYREIAERMGYNSRGNARHHVWAAEKKLKEILNADPYIQNYEW